METVTRFDGVSALVLEKLVELGYFKTRSEAIRAGVLGIAKEYNLLEDPKALEAELVVNKANGIDREIDAGKRKLTPAREVFKRAKIKIK